MIEGVKGKGQHRAKVTCDICGHSDVVACDYERHSGGTWVPNKGQVLTKLTAKKWANIKGALHCPGCDARRRIEASAQNQKDDCMQDTAPPEMTGLDKRIIIRELENVYDDSAKRYRGSYTDKAVAQELGGNVRAGWVKQVREEMFGPDGGNEEIEAINAEIEAIRKQLECGLNEFRASFDARIAELSKRLDGVCAAVGPRASARA